MIKLLFWNLVWYGVVWLWCDRKGVLIIRDGEHVTDSDHIYHIEGYYDAHGELHFLALSDADMFILYRHLLLDAWKSSKNGMKLFDENDYGKSLPVLDPGGNGRSDESPKDSEEMSERAIRQMKDCVLWGSFEVSGDGVFEDELDPMWSADNEHFSLQSLQGNIKGLNCDISCEFHGKTYMFAKLERKVVIYIMLATAISIGQVLLTIRQMEYAKPQAALQRMSFLSIAQHSVLDSYLCLFHLTTSMIMEPLFYAFVGVAFFQFVLFSVFELRLALLVWRAQRGNGVAGGIRRELAALYTRFYGIMFVGFIIAYNVNESVKVLLVFLYSFWIPQIWHTARKEARRPLDPVYVVGISLLKLSIPLYFTLYEGNFLGVPSSLALSGFLVLFVAVQCCVVLLQHYLQPAFFLPKGARPQKYNYFLPLPPVQEGDGEQRECVICMSQIHDQHKAYMVTPCGHVFHTRCLVRWMEVKLECPTCRAALPEVDDDDLKDLPPTGMEAV
eukprot:TRINITY_DN9137_c0_g1_i1.p1 TRINITY_DN9137_c0_g1~~TRINITY_DN9137_c0_g1_i1.p1  ORF type:complete len:501 (-),score=119.82 TRINITY_DN9137_c0_g1_i1:70-1572(-)